MGRPSALPGLANPRLFTGRRKGVTMIVNVFAGADPPYALIDGINSGRALSMLMRAIMSWYAFGRYDYVIVDLAGFDEWSPEVADQVATAVTTAADGGRWLAFFPVDEHKMRGAD